MRPIETDDFTFRYGVDYGELIDSMEIEVLVQVQDNDYQGDSRLLVKDGDRHGILIYGWGSCSGCDAAQAVTTLNEATELRDQLWNEIHWESNASAMAAYMRDKDWTLEYYGRSAETAQFVRESLENLEDKR